MSSPLVRVGSDFPSMLDLDIAAHGLPEVADLLGEFIALRAERTRAFIGEELAEVDIEYLLELTDRALVMDKHQGTPSEVMPHAERA